MDVFIILMNILNPLVIIGAGKLTKVVASKEVNGLIGYRTPRSMKNQDSWREANLVGGNNMLKSGTWCLVATIVLLMVLRKKLEVATIINCFLIFIPIVYTVYKTEKHLKETFDSYGCRIIKND